VAERAPLDTTLRCLLPGRDPVVTGRLDADMGYAARGPLKELVRRLGGRFRARGRAGRIQYATLGPKILELGPVAERLEAHETAQARTRGVDYREILARGTFDAGRVRLDRFTLDSRLLGLGLTGEVDLEAGHLALRGVVAPFGNVTGALRRVPVVGRLFGARIVGVPFSVSGDWHDPRVTPLGPEAIAGSFVDLLGRALNVPIRLLSPLIPSRERAP
jgi:AsmA-like C-terminal region